MFRSIRSKVLTFTILPLTITLLIIGFLAIIEKQKSENDLIINRLTTYRALLESGDLSLESLKDIAKLESLFNEKVEHGEIVKNDHTVSYSTPTTLPEERKLITQPLIDEAFDGVETTYSIQENERLLLVYVSPIIVNDKIVGALHVDLANEQTASRILQFAVMIVSAVVIAIFVCYLLVSTLLSSTVLNNISRLKRSTQLIESGDLDTKVESSSADEIGELAQTLEQMRKEVKSSRKSLEAVNNDLEKEVAERTVELQQKLEELERLNRFMVNREIKMIELKREVERLKQIHEVGH